MKSVMVQYCPCGHVDTSTNPDHIRKTKERAAKGFLDALILPTGECEECQDERRRQRAAHHIDPYED